MNYRLDVNKVIRNIETGYERVGGSVNGLTFWVYRKKTQERHYLKRGERICLGTHVVCTCVCVGGMCVNEMLLDKIWIRKRNENKEIEGNQRDIEHKIRWLRINNVGVTYILWYDVWPQRGSKGVTSRNGDVNCHKGRLPLFNPFYFLYHPSSFPTTTNISLLSFLSLVLFPLTLSRGSNTTLKP